MVPEFRNEPLVDFGVEANRRAFEAALKRIDDEATREWPLLIGGEPVTTGEWIEVHDPSDPTRLGPARPSGLSRQPGGHGHPGLRCRPRSGRPCSCAPPA
jgi:hypothetical protein